MRNRLLFFLLAAVLVRAERPLVLQTDFGLKDGAVAAMKGVAVGVSPRLAIYDLSHENTPYDIWEAAYRLKQAAPFWPVGTVFVSVIDPGVGTERKAVVLKTRSGHFFVGPDNGSWTLVAEDLGVEAVRQIDETRHRRRGSERSYTFHGRDIFAYVGAELAAGLSTFDDIGPLLAPKVMALAYERPRLEGAVLVGTIPALDFQYGNIWTNLDESLFNRLAPKFGERFTVTIARAGQVVYTGVLPYVRTFGDVAEGAPLLYLNSLMNVSFALNQGDFAKIHHIASGAEWSVRVEKGEAMRRLGLLVFLMALLPGLGAVAAERVEFTWPTPNKAWAEGRPISDYLQHAGSGDPESGGFGGVRSGGSQFHEGLDIKCVSRDRRGEPTDSVFAAMDGVVRHVNAVAGDSNYGRYVVLEHPGQIPGVYTLYAHLARITPGLRAGATVARGDIIGLMGHSSSGKIPRERAHLHFEMGVMVTRDFQSWYNSRKFGSPNEQGLWNGMNLMGFDPLDFLAKWRAGKVNTFREYFAQMEPAVRLRVATTRVPDYVLRYPKLMTKPLPAAVTGWEVVFDWTGLPFQWTPLTGTEAIGLPLNQPKIIEVNAALERRERSRTLVASRRGSWFVSHDLATVLEQLFGLR